MRIRNRSGSRSGSDCDLHAGREQRARSFSNSHRVGQKVTGRFLKRDASGLSWVSFDGLALLTKIGTEPPPGTQLRFIIQALTPDIVLKEDRGAGSGGGGGNAHAAMTFDAARTTFELAAHDAILAQDTTMPAEKRKGLLLSSLDQEQTTLYLRTALAQTAVNTVLARTGPTRLFYLPWLAPALRLDLILRSDRKEDGTQYHEVALGFNSPGLGPGQIRILSRAGRSGVRVFLDHPEYRPLAETLLTELGTPLGDDVTLLKPARPSRYAQGGVLQQILAKQPHALIGLGG